MESVFTSIPTNRHNGFIKMCSENPGLIEFVVENFSKLVAVKQLSPKTVSIPSAIEPIITDSILTTDERPSFAEAMVKPLQRLYPKQDPAPVSFPAPANEGDFCSVTIPEEVYKRRLEIFKDSFLGRVSFENQRISLKALKDKLQDLWDIRENWRLTPLGRGFFNVFIANPVDRQRVFRKKTWGLKSGSFRLSNWCPDFNPYRLSSSKAHVWIRFYELPFEYWDSMVIWALASSLGAPIRIDENTLNGEYGQFARVLVEVDFKNEVRDRILVKRANHSTFTYVVIENAPDFCNQCGIVGHGWENCRHRMKAPVEQATIPKKSGDKVWVTKVDNRVIDSSDLVIESAVTKGVGTDAGGSTVGGLSSVPIINSFNALDGLETDDDDGDKDSSMPPLMEVDEQGIAKICSTDAPVSKRIETTLDSSSNLSPISSREKQRRLSLENFEQFLQDSMVEPLTPKVQKAAQSAPLKMRPIALCARPEDSPTRRALNMGSTLNIVSKHHSSAAAAMNIAATREFKRLDSMKPP